MANRKFFYTRVASASDLAPEMHEPYPALVWNSVLGVSSEQMMSVVERLLATGCRYIVAAGTECERWHDSADIQFLAQFPTEQEQNANFVMTSWHTDESPEDVVFFFVNNTNFDDHDFKEFFILQDTFLPCKRDIRHRAIAGRSA